MLNLSLYTHTMTNKMVYDFTHAICDDEPNQPKMQQWENTGVPGS